MTSRPSRHRHSTSVPVATGLPRTATGKTKQNKRRSPNRVERHPMYDWLAWARFSFLANKIGSTQDDDRPPWKVVALLADATHAPFSFLFCRCLRFVCDVTTVFTTEPTSIHRGISRRWPHSLGNSTRNTFFIVRRRWSRIIHNAGFESEPTARALKKRWFRDFGTHYTHTTTTTKRTATTEMGSAMKIFSGIY